MAVAKKRRAYPGINIKDLGGNTIGFHPIDGEADLIDISNGYAPKSPLAIANGFWICPLSEGVIKVRLLSQLDDVNPTKSRSFVIAEVRVFANIGQYLDEKCAEILKDGTTVESAMIAWTG